MSCTCTKCGASIDPKDFYILCEDCQPVQITLCLLCFANGATFQRHKPDHSYVVMRLDFSLHTSDWAAAEEIKLLDGLRVCGYGNWSDIASYIGGKTPQDCEDHYREYFPLPCSDSSTAALEDKKADDSDASTDGYDEAGEEASEAPGSYSSRRREYSVEWRNAAEKAIAELSLAQDWMSQDGHPGNRLSPPRDGSEEDKGNEDSQPADDSWSLEDETLYRETRLGVVYGYWGVLKQRSCRRSIVSRLGLRRSAKLHEHRRLLSLLPQGCGEKLLTLLRLQHPCANLLRSYTDYVRKRAEVSEVRQARQAGIKRLGGLSLWREQRRRRDRRTARAPRLLERALAAVQRHQEEKDTTHVSRPVLTSVNLLDNSLLKAAKRKKPASPMDVAVLPGCEQLYDDERELCSRARMAPLDFLKYKSLLQAECSRSGCVKLATARLLLRIDVNKTRRLFDFLVRKETIVAPDDYRSQIVS